MSYAVPYLAPVSLIMPPGMQRLPVRWLESAGLSSAITHGELNRARIAWMPPWRSIANGESFVIHLNGRSTRVHAGMTVAAAILEAGSASRRSVRSEPRQPLCGMGICFECRARVNGIPHSRTCQILCESGMEVTTDE